MSKLEVVFFVRMLFKPNGTYVCVNEMELNGIFMVCLCDYAFMIIEKQKCLSVLTLVFLDMYT